MTDKQDQTHEDCDCVGCVLMTAMGGISIMENAYFLGLAGQLSGEIVDWKAIAEKVVSTGYGVGVLINNALRQLAGNDDAAETPAPNTQSMTPEELKALFERGLGE